MSWRLLAFLAIAVAAPIAPPERHVPAGPRLAAHSLALPSPPAAPTPAPPPTPHPLPRQVQADPLDGTSQMGIIAPIVIGGVIAIAVACFLFWGRLQSRRAAQNINTAEAAAPLAENAAPEPRRRRGLNLAGGLGRSESGRSIRTLPAYTKDAGDEERVLLRRDPSLSSGGHHERRLSDMSGLSVVTEGAEEIVAPHYWGEAPSYDLGYGYGFGDAYDPPDEPPPDSLRGAHRSAPTRSQSVATARSASTATSPSMVTARASLASVPPLSIPRSPSPSPSASTTTGSPSMVTARSALSTPTRRSPHPTPPPARSASYAASHRSVSSRHPPVRAASAPPLPHRAGVMRASEALPEVVREGVTEEPGEEPEVQRDRRESVGPAVPRRTPTPTAVPVASAGTASTPIHALESDTPPHSRSESPTPTPTPTTGPDGWTRLRMLSPS